MTLSRLHVVTDDEVLSGDSFVATARALLSRFGPRVALHLRGHGLGGRRLWSLASMLAPEADRAGSALLVADRADVVLATPGTGLRLGRHSIPVPSARAMLPDRLLAYSAHGADEARRAVDDGANFVVLGTIWATASHRGREPAGPELVERTARMTDVPIVAIGGVTPARAAEAVSAGAHGVAVLRGVWRAEDPASAVAEYLDAMPPVERSVDVSLEPGR